MLSFPIIKRQISVSTTKTSKYQKTVFFSILKTARVYKGIVSEWDSSLTLDELYDAITVKDNILEIERIVSRKYDKVLRRLNGYRTDLVC